MLKLDEFLPEDEYIESPTGERFKITARVSRELFMRIMVVSEDFQAGANTATVEKVNGIIVDILSIRNDRKKVIAFLDSMSMQNWNRVVSFIMKYITNSVSTENDKKKTD